MKSPRNVLRWLFDGRRGPADKLIPRWIFLRALALIYFSAFYSLLFQIKGLIGPRGILPAGQYLAAVGRSLDGDLKYWYAPSVFWFSSSDRMLMTATWVGLIAAVIAFLNVWPRLSFFVCWVCFLAFVASSSEFSSYQSDGMLLEAGFLALFFVPRGLMPGWGAQWLPPRASLWLLQWEWFRIYFESGMVKLLSGDEQWRHLTAMDEYYQNGPLPTWIGWYAEHLPHWFQAATALGTLVMELGIVLMLFFPRRVRLICFLIVTPWEIGVIVTANYTFLNYLVLALGFLLLDDRTLRRLVPVRWRPEEPVQEVDEDEREEEILSLLATDGSATAKDAVVSAALEREEEFAEGSKSRGWRGRLAGHRRALGLAVSAVMLTWIAYDTTAEMIGLPLRGSVLPMAPVEWLEPFRIANQYGLFAVMTRGRYDIEFQGSNDGVNWTPYLFRNKPQLLNEAPRIYAPYQPRFDWNLWFASLGDWHGSQIVPLTEERLLENDGDVLALFKGNPFPQSPPRLVRAVLWQYWFTSMDEKQRTGNWWRRKLLGLYAPELTRGADGRFAVVEWSEELGPHD
ncbi:MAG: lipase maturation factor family protein [Terracidiphilus sp.]